MPAPARANAVPFAVLNNLARQSGRCARAAHNICSGSGELSVLTNFDRTLS
eukprot:SAG31_NODE_34750_length_329_cov_2.182609_1_plen_50_part_10